MRIEERFGRPVQCSADCQSLSECIFEVTRRTIGVTTLMRMFGLVNENPTPRISTMNQIAQYLGYKDMKEMEKMLATVDKLNFENLKTGTIIQISYDPQSLLVMAYMGDNWFLINESHNSTLQKGDKVRIFQLAKGFELLAAEVVRHGKSLGSYRSAKVGGLTLIKII